MEDIESLIKSLVDNSESTDNSLKKLYENYDSYVLEKSQNDSEVPEETDDFLELLRTIDSSTTQTIPTASTNTTFRPLKSKEVVSPQTSPQISKSFISLEQHNEEMKKLQRSYDEKLNQKMSNDRYIMYCLGLARFKLEELTASINTLQNKESKLSKRNKRKLSIDDEYIGDYQPGPSFMKIIERSLKREKQNHESIGLEKKSNYVLPTNFNNIHL